MYSTEICSAGLEKIYLQIVGRIYARKDYIERAFDDVITLLNAQYNPLNTTKRTKSDHSRRLRTVKMKQRQRGPIEILINRISHSEPHEYRAAGLPDSALAANSDMLRTSLRENHVKD